MINFALGSKLGGGCNQPGSNATKTVNFSCDIFGNATKYLLQASDYFGNSRYQFIDNVKPNDSYDVHFSEMTNFDKVVKFTYPANPSLLLIVEGRESGQSIYDNGYLCFKYWGQSPTQASAEYINALSSYTTYLLLTYPGFFYFYNSHGIVPTNNIAISTPPSFSLSSKSLQNFSSIAGGEFVYRASEYVNRDQLDPFLVSNWIVYSTSSTHVLKSLPNKIAQGIAGLQLENYTHTYTTFTLQSSPYLEAVFREAGSTYTTSGVIIR
jgi:hypothetical protein